MLLNFNGFILIFQFHVEKDATKHCALSCVTRWSYIFADHICKELDIELVPGKHLPHNADVTTVNSILDDEDMSVCREY